MTTGVFRATFFSRCSQCPEPVRKGHEVVFANGALSHAQHHRGPEAEPREVCPWCRIELPKDGICCR